MHKIVSKTNYLKCVDDIVESEIISLDTETTGLEPYHGDRLFSMSISNDKTDYYFNFKEYEGLDDSLVLPKSNLSFLKDLKAKIVFAHNAKYDLLMLRQEDIEIKNWVHCTKVVERVLSNELKSGYSLAACGERRKIKKDDTVEKYIKDNNLYTSVTRANKSFKKPRYDLVPFPIISKYAMIDSRVCLTVGLSQIEKTKMHRDYGHPSITASYNVVKNEGKLVKTLSNMEHKGGFLDRKYTEKALIFEENRMIKLKEHFKNETGSPLVISEKCFSEIFASDKENWGWTDKGNPSFKSKFLKNFKNPLAQTVLDYKKAKSNYDFFKNFLFFADTNDVIHTTYDSSGTRTGRFSSKNPNLQNLKKDEISDDIDLDQNFVRRAIIPRPDHFFVMIDYDQLEYRLMLDYAKADKLIDKVLGGLDVHTATAEMAGCTRKQAKTVNFLTLYGGGQKKLAEDLGVSLDKAKKIQDSIFQAAPEILEFKNKVISAAERHKKIFNWLGRKSDFPNKRMCYKAPNTLIQGGANDIVKVAMVNCFQLLKNYKTDLLFNIHDELVFEMHKSEAHLIPILKDIMQSAYPYRRLPMTCGAEYSFKSLADKVEFTGLESLHGKKTGDSFQGESSKGLEEAGQHLVRQGTAGIHQRYT